jgi:DNA end-binding protein Ku
MAARSIATLTLSFGLVSIPVRLYSATESASSIRFNLLAKDGSRLKQQYISEKTQRVVPRAEMVKGYEFEKDHFVIFTAEELDALEEESSHVVDIVAFIPEKSVDPLYYDKPYLLAPDKRGAKPYALLAEAMRKSGRCALAKWAWKAKQYVVQIRPAEGGMVLQQLLYAAEVRSFVDLNIEPATVTPAELQLALQLIGQISEESYDATQYKDEERQRILDAIDRKIAGKQIVATTLDEQPTSGQVIDLMEALKASLQKKPAGAVAKIPPAKSAKSNVQPLLVAGERKPARRTAKPDVTATPATRGRSKK